MLGEDWLYDIDGFFCNSVEGTYYMRGGFYYDGSTAADDFAAAAKAKAARSGGWVSALCRNASDLNTVVKKLKGDGAGFTTSTSYDKNTYYIATAPLNNEHSHIWSTPSYTWAPDNSQITAVRICWAPDYRTVTANRVCSRQTGENCTETETANTTSQITRKPTYTAKGQTTYTADFANPAFQARKVVTNIPMLAKKTNTMKVKATAKTVKAKTLKKKAVTVAPLKVTYAKGTVTYKLAGGSAKSKKALKLNTKTGKVTVRKKTKKGKYQIKVKVTAAGTTVYKALSKTVTVTVKVK